MRPYAVHLAGTSIQQTLQVGPPQLCCRLGFIQRQLCARQVGSREGSERGVRPAAPAALTTGANEAGQEGSAVGGCTTNRSSNRTSRQLWQMPANEASGLETQWFAAGSRQRP